MPKKCKPQFNVQYIEALSRYPVQFSQVILFQKYNPIGYIWKEWEKEIIALGIWGNKQAIKSIMIGLQELIFLLLDCMTV